METPKYRRSKGGILLTSLQGCIHDESDIRRIPSAPLAGIYFTEERGDGIGVAYLFLTIISAENLSMAPAFRRLWH